jgi:hypothetical protein
LTLRPRHLIVGAFALLSVFFTGQFPPFVNPNELSRFEMVYAAVEDGTFTIDHAISVLGDHEDKAASQGHFYSNKAPGLALAAIPVYRLLRIFLPRPASASDPIFLLLRILVVSSVCAIALARFQVRLEPLPAAPLVAFAAAFGTPFLFYSRTFFSHAWTASLLFLAWDLLVRAEDSEHVRRVTALPLAAGFLAMWATISEYPVAVVGVLLALRASSRKSWNRLALFAAGAAVPLLLLGVYNSVCFGSPFVVSSAREASANYAGLGWQEHFGFGLPSAVVAWRYLLDSNRGLLISSPFFLWVAPGFWRWWRSGARRADALLALSATALYFVLLTGYSNWHAGWSLGNRYLLPVLFFSALALPYALDRPVSRSLFLGAAFFSVGVHFVLTLSWPHFPPDLVWPVGTGAAWFLARGWTAPNVASAGRVLSLLLPALVTLAAAAVAVRSSRLSVSRQVAGVLIGLALAGGAVLYRPEPAYGARLWRAAVFGAYSGLDPSRRELREVVLSARTAAERRQAMGAWRLYGSRR